MCVVEGLFKTTEETPGAKGQNTLVKIETAYLNAYDDALKDDP